MPIKHSERRQSPQKTAERIINALDTYGDAELYRLAQGYLRAIEALRYMADYQLTGTEQTLHIDFQGKAREVLDGR